MLFGQTSNDEKALAASIGVNPYFIKDYLFLAKNYGYDAIEAALLLLHEYNLKGIGVNSVATDDDSLLKELMVKIMM